MKNMLLICLFGFATAAVGQSPCSKFTAQFLHENPSADIVGFERDSKNGTCLIEKWPAVLGARPTQAQVDAIVAAYDARMATKQAAADALYSTISTRLSLATPITTKAQLQSRITEVWDALNDKEQSVWTAIESGGLNATRAGQLKQLAEARNKILRLLAEDGIQ
jgi:hypothetical protein